MPPKSVSHLALSLQAGEIDFRNATIQECVRTILCDWATTTSGKRTDPSKLHPLAPYLLEGVRRGLGLEMLAGVGGAGVKKGAAGAAKSKPATKPAGAATPAAKKRAAPTGGKAGTATAPASRAKKAKVDAATPQSQQWVGMGMGFFSGMSTPAPSMMSGGLTPLPGWGLEASSSRRMTSPPMPRPVTATPKPKAKRGPKKEEKLDEGFDLMGFGSAYRM